MAHSMTDSSVIPIDGGTGAREQASQREGGEPLHIAPEAAGEPKENSQSGGAEKLHDHQRAEGADAAG